LATLYIFGDESGTMPVKDNDKPFVAATVAVLDNTPALINGSDDDKKLVEIFKELNVIPFVAIVKPFPGYGKAVKVKHDKMQVMARATRLVTGANAQYLDQKTRTYGLDLRNTVWCHAMLQAIARTVLHTVFTSPIDVVQIVLDQKTMRPPMRLFFKEMVVQQMGVGTRQFLRNLLPMNPSVISQWESHVRFSAKTTSINWSDESKELEEEFGLKLVDRFARKMYQAQATHEAGIETILRDAGFDDFVVDISEVVTRLDQRVVDNFKRNTGLPEPREL
jgi:hypothetical protein